MSWRPQLDEHGVIIRYKDTDTGEVLSAKEYERRLQMPQQPYASMMPGMSSVPAGSFASPYAAPPYGGYATPGAAPAANPPYQGPAILPGPATYGAPPQGLAPGGMQAGAPPAMPQTMPGMPGAGPQGSMPMAPVLTANAGPNPLIQPGAKMLSPGANPDMLSGQGQVPVSAPRSILNSPTQGMPPTAGQAIQGKSLRLEGVPHAQTNPSVGYKNHGFLDATSIAILLPTLVLLALIIAAAHKKRLFPWQTIRTFNPPSGLMTPRDYERSYLCPPNLRRHGRLGKRNPNATWTDVDGVVIPFGFLARTHLPVTIPLGRLPNKNMFLVAPSGSGKTTLMRAIIKALLAKPCVIIALEAKANDPNLDEKREGFKYSILPEAEHAGFDALYFNPLDSNSIQWNPLELDPINFASSIVQDVNSLPPEEQHWAERDHGYIYGLAQILKWGGVQVVGEDENGSVAEVQPLPRNPRGLMKLVNNRRNIVESLRRLKTNPDIDASELSEMTQMLSSIIRTDSDWDKNIQGIRGRLRMFKNPGVLRVTEQSNIDLRSCMNKPTVLIFGAPASLGPDAESLAGCFVYQLQQALHTRYGTKSVLPLFAFFDEYQTLNIDLAGRLSAIVRGANGGLAVILQNISQITAGGETGGSPASGELKTIFSNSAVRVCLHNADETTARFFSEEIGKHAVVVPGIADHYQANGFGIFPTSWNRIHSQQVVQRVDSDSIKRMEKHHALVYLAPAGDPEFGEVKPLMCDLRGIEEIARLHLLHNVSARRPNPPDPNGSGPAGPGGDGPPSNLGPPSGQFPMAGPPGAQFPVTGEQLAVTGQIIGDHLTNAQYPAAGEPAAVPQFPTNALNNFSPVPEQFAPQSGGAPAPMFPVAASYPTAQPAPPSSPPASTPPAAATTGTAPSGARICPSCNKAAGKGKFCIECGAFVGAAASTVPAEQAAAVAQPAALEADAAGQVAGAPTFPTFARPGAADQQGVLKRTSVLESAQQIAEAGQSQTGVIQGGKRQPVTSFNLDPSRLGYNATQPKSSSKKGSGNGGVEF